VRLIVAAADRLLIADPVTGATRTELEERGPVCLAVAGNRVWCGTRGHGVYRSDDAGASWRPAGLDGRWLTAIAATDTAVYAGTEPSAVLSSEDAGATWRELRGLLDLPSSRTWSFPPRPSTHHVRAILVDPVEPETIHVAIEAGALVRTVDGGRTWEDRRPRSPYDTHTLAAHPAAPGWIGSAAGDGWFESDDRGITWRSPEEGLEDGYLWSVAVDAGDSGTVVVSAAPGPRPAHDARRAESRVYRRSGGAWRPVEGLPEPRGTTVASLAADPAEPRTFWAASNRGLYRSEDGGARWELVDIAWPPAFASERVDAFALAPLG
jgi:photosystem II stability/assembly factor-like uncharacterized protein